MSIPATLVGKKKRVNFFARGLGEKKLMKKVAKNRYFVICAKSLLENMNSNEAEKTVKENRGKVPDAQTEGECGPKDCDNRVIMVYEFQL